MSAALLSDTLLKPITDALQGYYKSHKITVVLIVIAILIAFLVLCFSNSNSQPKQLNITQKYAKTEE